MCPRVFRLHENLRVLFAGLQAAVDTNYVKLCIPTWCIFGVRFLHSMSIIFEEKKESLGFATKFESNAQTRRDFETSEFISMRRKPLGACEGKVE